MWTRSIAAGVVLAVAAALAASCARVGGGFDHDLTPGPGTVAEAMGPAAEEELRGEVDRPPKQVHLAVRMILLSDADAQRVSAEALPDWRPGEARAPGVLKTFDFAELQAFFLFLRTKTRGSMTMLPQWIARDREEATIDLEEGAGRKLALFAGPTEAGQAEPAPEPDLKLGEAGRLFVMPHFAGPGNDVILTVVAIAPQPAAESEAPSGGSLGQLRLPQTNTGRAPVTKALLRSGETVVVGGGLGEWRGQEVNVLVAVTPTVIDFEKKPDIDRAAERAREELGKGFALEEQGVPPSASPDR
jgi:hypothetical protein